MITLILRILKKFIFHFQVFCQAAVRSLYSVEETVNVFALAFLQILAESDVGRFLTHFPPREIELFKEFFFDKVRKESCDSSLGNFPVASFILLYCVINIPELSQQQQNYTDQACFLREINLHIYYQG